VSASTTASATHTVTEADALKATLLRDRSLPLDKTWSCHRRLILQRSRTVAQGTDTERAHHRIVFMREDMAVPDIETRDVKMRPDAGDLARIDKHGVLAAHLPWIRRGHRPRDQVGWLGSNPVRAYRQGLPVDDLKSHLVDMDGVRIRREIRALPELCRVERRIFGDGCHPWEGGCSCHRPAMFRAATRRVRRRRKRGSWNRRLTPA
jgi:hypothetical protein